MLSDLENLVSEVLRGPALHQVLISLWADGNVVMLIKY